jgi:hypothetical protein
MVGHAIWFDKCSIHFHVDDGRYPATIHQYFCSGVSGQHSHLRQDLGQTLASYSAGFAHPMVARAICQLGNMLVRHGQVPLPGLHN